ncbi:MAG: hypothetical protein D5R98_08225 [Desulfonatronovibrio sp. MSAO_Bac4]|nr:MAG: hypothetical protein D5R98_08225 [Desulfonatronovibrio sp. MSAO_Bac4]
MYNLLNSLNKILFGILAVAGTIMVAGVKNIGATTIQWHFYDMHSDMEGAVRLIDPANLLVPFLIMIIIGLVLWRTNVKISHEEENKDADHASCKTA